MWRKVLPRERSSVQCVGARKPTRNVLTFSFYSDIIQKGSHMTIPKTLLSKEPSACRSVTIKRSHKIMNQNSIDKGDIGKRSGFRPLRTLILSTLIIFIASPATVFASSHRYLAENAPRFVDEITEQYGEMIKIAALLQDYDEKLIIAVMVVESEGRNTAVSHRGAQGLMQLMPATAEYLGVTDAHDPFQNILAGTRYLKMLETRYGFKNPQEALIAYNMGPTRAKRWLSQYAPEDYLYVQKVMFVHGLIAETERKQNLAVEEVKTTPASTDDLATLAKPLLTRPRTLALAAFPLLISNDRRDDTVREK